MTREADRLANYAHLLRELVHLSGGWLALEPRLEVKLLLGDHLYDDARAVTRLRRRLTELEAEPGAPGAELAALLDRASAATGPAEYAQIAYGELKPALLDAIRIHVAGLDPVLDEPALRLLTGLAQRQERHVVELAIPSRPAVIEDLASEPVRPGEHRTLRVLAPVTRPARDDFVAPAADGAAGHPLHDLAHEELCRAEVAARSSHEHPTMPWEFHLDMARQAADGLRHVRALDRLMGEEGVHWGDHPVDLARFTARYAGDLAGRLALVDGGDDLPASQMRAARRLHARAAARWRPRLAGRAPE